MAQFGVDELHLCCCLSMLMAHRIAKGKFNVQLKNTSMKIYVSFRITSHATTEAVIGIECSVFHHHGFCHHMLYMDTFHQGDQRGQ